MKFVLFVEGETERKCLPQFVKKWLDAHLSAPPGVQAVKFEGCSRQRKDQGKHARMHLEDDDVIAVISLMDLYGPGFYPANKSTAEDRYVWAKAHLETEVGHSGFRQHFAVHETEAWILSDPSVLPKDVKPALSKTVYPEKVNFTEPPSKLLGRLYATKTSRGYKKVTDGTDLFRQLNPETVYQKCPHFKQMMEEMLALAKDAGLE